MTDNIVGSFEVVSFPDLGVIDKIAKVDTGAYSGALHCTDIKVIRRGITRKRILTFCPLGKSDLATETETFEKISVRSSTGHTVQRYLIDTSIVIDGQKYPIRIGISDRSDLKKPILIGRRFLREQAFLVDVRMNQEHDDEGDSA
ncbi:MAG TPA: RimK/LysX family protein [Candidatus Limnocylindrales bacterium]|nr:RimK/LysX family protein [Candidatus Limnocylindrales bacterium]